jgi:formate hydrogenlyase subunit 5
VKPVELTTAASRVPDWLGAIAGGEAARRGDHEVALVVQLERFGPAVRELHDLGARFVTLLTARSPEPALVCVLARRGELVRLSAPTGAEIPSYRSLAAWWPAAEWAERELTERGEIEARGLAPRMPLTAPDADRLDRDVSGLDVFVIPHGPVRSGIFEAIQFQIETGGEDVLRLQTRPFFKHRQLERRFVGLTPDDGAHVAERIAGVASVAHSIAFAQAVERALDVEVPARAQRWRAVYAELERIANHLDVIAKEAETTALFVGQARFQIAKENVLRLQATLTGNRFARGVVVPGGVRFDGRVELDALLGAIDSFERNLRRDRRLFLETASMTDRLIGSGALDRKLLEDFGAVGPLARGSGLSVDARHERPYGDYRRLGLQVMTETAGDAMARVQVRFAETSESLRILRQAVDQLRRKDGQLATELPAASGQALGWAEAPQGEIVTWVELTDGVIDRVRVASPSFRNWPLFDHAFPADVLTDFAFIEHSFGLTPAGADR